MLHILTGVDTLDAVIRVVGVVSAFFDMCGVPDLQLSAPIALTPMRCDALLRYGDGPSIAHYLTGDDNFDAAGFAHAAGRALNLGPNSMFHGGIYRRLSTDDGIQASFMGRIGNLSLRACPNPIEMSRLTGQKRAMSYRSRAIIVGDGVVIEVLHAPVVLVHVETEGRGTITSLLKRCFEPYRLAVIVDGELVRMRSRTSYAFKMQVDVQCRNTPLGFEYTLPYSQSDWEDVL